MPYPPSIGDIITLTLLIKDLITALSETRGSPTEYQDCISKLQTLAGVVREVDSLCNNSDRKNSFTLTNARRETLLCVVRQCERWIEGVLMGLRKYGPSLRKGGSGGRVRDALVRVQWRVLRSEELGRIGVEVVYFCAVFSSHMSSATLHLLERNEETLQTGLESVKDVVFLMNEERRLLKDIRDQSLENNRLVRSSTSSTTAKFAESLEWFRSLSLELTKVSQGVFFMPWLIYRLFQSGQGNLPSYLERCLYPETLSLRDSHDRITQISLRHFDSWPKFFDLLDRLFREKIGYQLVQDKRYVLHEAAEDRDIELWRPWEVAFRPGQKIVMCVVIVDYTDWICCPFCFSDSPVPFDVEIECTECRMRYRWESESYENWKPGNVTPSKRKQLGSLKSLSDPNTSKKRRMELTPDDDATSFNCVRMVSQNRFEPGRSRLQWIQQFNKAIVFGRQTRNNIFEQRPEIFSRYIERVRSTYQKLGYEPAIIDKAVEELLPANPRLSVISDLTRSVASDNVAPSWLETKLVQGRRHKRRKIVTTRPTRINSRRLQDV